MFIEAIERDELTGTFNAVGPNPVTNREFMRELRRALHRPWTPPAPEWAVKFSSRLMGTEPSLALTGCRVAPKRFFEAGFQFKFAELDPALKDLYPQEPR
jgi:NAD dependent epimerase/dehydratase family enzyme